MTSIRKRLDGFATNLAIQLALDEHPTPYSRIARKAGGFWSPSVTLNATKTKNILDTLTQLGIADHEEKKRTDNQLPTQLYRAKDPVGLRNSLRDILNNPFVKSLGYSVNTNSI